MRFAITVNSGGATFVKTYDYFVETGGLTESWGKAWKIVEAKDIHAARVMAIKLPGAQAGLYCADCGREDVKCICGRCLLCSKERRQFQRFCGAACTAKWEAGERPKASP